jgi:hypothetical protein
MVKCCSCIQEINPLGSNWLRKKSLSSSERVDVVSQERNGLRKNFKTQAKITKGMPQGLKLVLMISLVRHG